MSDKAESWNAPIDDPRAPDIFADAVMGLHELGGVVRVTLESWRTDFSAEGSPVRRVTVARLVMTSDAAERMANGVLHLLARNRALTSVAAAAQDAESVTVN